MILKALGGHADRVGPRFEFKNAVRHRPFGALTFAAQGQADIRVRRSQLDPQCSGRIFQRPTNVDGPIGGKLPLNLARLEPLLLQDHLVPARLDVRYG